MNNLVKNFQISIFESEIKSELFLYNYNKITDFINTDMRSMFMNCGGSIALLKENKLLYSYLQLEFNNLNGINFDKFIGESFDYFFNNFEKEKKEDEIYYFNSLVEYNLSKLKSRNDPKFLKQDKRKKRLPSTRFVDISSDTLLFRTWSAEHSSNHKEYTERIKMKNLIPKLVELKKKNKKIKRQQIVDTIKKEMLSGDLEIFCSCPAFLYWGFRFISTKYDAIIQKYAEHRYPIIRNPNLRGMYCKHMALVIDVLPFVTSKVSKKFYDKYMVK